MAVTYQDLRKKINLGKRELGEIEKYLKEGEALEKEIEKNAYQVEDKLRKIELRIARLKELEDLHASLANLKEFIRDRQKLLEQPKQRLKLYLGSELDRAFKEKGWPVQGNLPELKVGLLTLEFLLSEGQVKIWYGPKIELMDRTELVIDGIVNMVTAIFEGFDKASFQDEEDFLKLLFDSYHALIKRDGQESGTGIPIISWLGEIAWSKQDRKFLADPRREHFAAEEQAVHSRKAVIDKGQIETDRACGGDTRQRLLAAAA
ncbi:MAG: hypothetical protein ACMUIA_12190, partial [bacterium]